MIYMYTGTPGSGKSYHVARDIVARLKRGGGLICNFPINTDVIKNVKGDFIYKDNSELTLEFLSTYAKEHHCMGKENQSLVVVDEAQVLFNCRDFSRGDRAKWVTFFSQHRKYGYNIILVTQNDRMIDRQIRSLVEYEIKHRKINNYGFGGLLLSFTFMTWFVAIEKWYGMQGQEARLGASFFPYLKKYSKIYDSYMLFHEEKEVKIDVEVSASEVEAGGNRDSGGALDGASEAVVAV